MNTLTVKGKLHFQVKSRAISHSEVKRWKKQALKLLDEQQITADFLDEFYREIYVCFMYDRSESSLQPPKSAAAQAVSSKHVGCVEVYLKEFKGCSDDDRKLVLFEELIHLAQSQGRAADTPFSYRRLKSKYDCADKTVAFYGKYLLDKLLHDRTHFTTYLIMLDANGYPEQWTKHYIGKILEAVQTPKQAIAEHEAWKNDKEIPHGVSNARLVTSYLATSMWLFLFEKACMQNVSQESLCLLKAATAKCMKECDATRTLIMNEMGAEAVSLVDGCVTEQVLTLPDTFFTAVSRLWEELKLM